MQYCSLQVPVEETSSERMDPCGLETIKALESNISAEVSALSLVMLDCIH